MPNRLPNMVLVFGIPRAGKSSFCDAVETAHAGFTHVPLDRYIRPVPNSTTFLQWVATPDCIAWDHLLAHLDLLNSGSHCFTPRQNWAAGGDWVSAGGALAEAPGRKMRPASTAYLIAGTHAFAFPPGRARALRVFIQTPDRVVAERFAGTPDFPGEPVDVIRHWIGDNARPILSQAASADLTIDGTASRAEQVSRFIDFFRRFVAGT